MRPGRCPEEYRIFVEVGAERRHGRDVRLRSAFRRDGDAKRKPAAVGAVVDAFVGREPETVDSVGWNCDRPCHGAFSAERHAVGAFVGVVAALARSGVGIPEAPRFVLPVRRIRRESHGRPLESSVGDKLHAFARRGLRHVAQGHLVDRPAVFRRVGGTGFEANDIRAGLGDREPPVGARPRRQAVGERGDLFRLPPRRAGPYAHLVGTGGLVGRRNAGDLVGAGLRQRDGCVCDGVGVFEEQNGLASGRRNVGLARRRPILVDPLEIRLVSGHVPAVGLAAERG